MESSGQYKALRCVAGTVLHTDMIRGTKLSIQRQFRLFQFEFPRPTAYLRPEEPVRLTGPRWLGEPRFRWHGVTTAFVGLANAAELK